MKILYLIFIYIFLFQNIISVPYCFENKKGYIKCNPINNLCVKCQYDILIPDNDSGCIGQEKISIRK